MLATGLTSFAGPAFAQTAVPPPSQAAAQDAPPPSDPGNDIVVTANRQSSRSQTVPIALTAISGDQLVKSGITTAGQLSQLAPSMYVQEGIGAGSPRFSLRGVTSSDTAPAGSAAVALYLDDVYQASQYSIGFQLFDLQRVEVLRGPQGTTFGKNTTAGAVAYFSQVPTNDASGYVTGRLAGGDRSQRFVEGAINVPIIDDKLALRVSMQVDSRGNWLRDVVQNVDRGKFDSQSGRAQLRWTPSVDTVVNLTVYGTRGRGDPAFYQANLTRPCNVFGGAVTVFCPNGVPSPTPRANPDTLGLDPLNLYEAFNNYGASLRVEQKVGTLNLTAISHFRKSDLQNALDLDGAVGDLLEYYQLFRNKQYGQELRLGSDPTQQLSGLLGLYYQYDQVYFGNALGTTLNGAGSDSLLRYNDLVRTKTYAAFANLTFKITDRLSVIGGLRKSIERKTHTGETLHFLPGAYDWSQKDMLYQGAPPVAPDFVVPINQRQNSAPWTWDATLNFRPTSRFMAFARVARGFRSGGFNSLSSVYETVNPPPFQGETLQSYELGFKSDPLGRALRVNGGVYHYDYTNQQVSAVAVGGIYTTTNAGTSKVDGAELEIVSAPVRGLEMRGSIGYVNARFTNYNDGAGSVFDGRQLLYSPKWTANANVSYTTPVSSALNLRAGTSWSYRSTIFFDAANTRSLRAVPLTLGNFRLALEPAGDKGFTIAAFVNNVTNKKPVAYAFSFEPGFDAKTFLPGVAYGIDVSFHW